MKTIDIQVSLEDTPFGRSIKKNLLGEYDFSHSDSEPRIKYFTYFLENQTELFRDGVGKHANRLLKIAKRKDAREIENLSHEVQLVRRNGKNFGKLIDGNAFELPPELDLNKFLVLAQSVS